MRTKGFTLIEVLITILIIGIVAAIAIPNLLTAIQKSKQKGTMADMRGIGAAIESYITDNQMAPGGGSADFTADLESYLVPFHSKPLPIIDAWGTKLRYRSGAVGPTQDLYSIFSYGKDQRLTGINPANSNYPVKAIDDFDKDICFSNGNFTYAPKVK